MRLRRCRGCDQFFKGGERACPHCGQAVPSSTLRAAVLGAVAATVLVQEPAQYATPIYGTPAMPMKSRCAGSEGSVRAEPTEKPATDAGE